MSKLIAVCGSPASGKTTTALKVAEEIYYHTNLPVLFISPDTNIPSLAYLFPRSKENELFSLGEALDKTTITCEDILKQTIYTKNMRNFGFLGLKLGENKYSFPKPTGQKIREFFYSCEQIAPIVVVDCTSYFDDLISEIAIRESDVNIQLISPDLRSMGYYSAYEEKYKAFEDKCVKVITLMDNDLFLPIEEIKTHFKSIEYVIPYSRALKQQAITGTLVEKISDIPYKSVCLNIAKRVLDVWVLKQTF